MYCTNEARLSSSPANPQTPEATDPRQVVTARRIEPGTDAERKPPAAESDLTPERIIKILRDAEVHLFCDQYGHAFAALPWDRPGEHLECVPIRTKRFRQRLNGLIHKATQNKASLPLLRQTIPELELCCEEATSIDLHNRVALAEDRIYVDLGDDLWRTVLVTPEGYRTIQDRVPRFFRSKHQRPLPEPIAGGTPDELFAYIPVDDESDRLSLLTWAVSALCPNSPTPILLFTGQQGSAKTTRCRRMRSLIDPSRVPVMEQPGNRDLLQVLYHHAVPCFENVSGLTRKQADIFCRAVTGSGVERRKLYSDMDEQIFDFQRPIMMNGIDIPSTRPDFLDRCLVIPCTRIPEFQSVATLDAEFERAKPRLWGAILDLLAKTLSQLPSTPSSGTFRMADFAHFGRAVARALGKTPEDFDNAYRANLAQQHRELFEDCPFARAVVELSKAADRDNPLELPSDVLLKRALVIAKQLGLPTDGPTWPRSPRWASTRLSELTQALANEGTVADRLPRRNNCRPWRLYAIA